MKALLLLVSATAFNSGKTASMSAFKNAVKSDQAAFFSSFTCDFASCAIVPSSSSVAIISPSIAKAKIHSLNLLMQSNSDSHVNRSADL